MNPFSGNAMAIESLSSLLNRDQTIEKLKERIEREPTQTVIMGVKGCGKSSILKSLFDAKYRIEKAKENILISSVTEFPEEADSEKIYDHFTAMVTNSIQILSRCGEGELKKEIAEHINSLESHTPSRRFESVVNSLHDIYGFRIVMVIDNFEKFTTSSVVTNDHHEVLLNLLDKSQYIVATNFDLNQTSLPEKVAGSHFITRFAGNEITVEGWSKLQTVEFLTEKLKDNEIQFSDNLKKEIYLQSGGIPTLINATADLAYNELFSNPDEGLISFDKLLENNLVKKHFELWSALLTDAEVETLYNMSNDIDNVSVGAQEPLSRRGILKKNNRNGSYSFSCELYKSFCKNKQNLISAAATSPLKISKNIIIENSLDIETVRENSKDQVNGICSRLIDQAKDCYNTAKQDEKEYKGLSKNKLTGSKRIKLITARITQAEQLKNVDIPKKRSQLISELDNAKTVLEIDTILKNTDTFQAEIEAKLSSEE